MIATALRSVAPTIMSKNITINDETWKRLKAAKFKGESFATLIDILVSNNSELLGSRYDQKQKLEQRKIAEAAEKAANRRARVDAYIARVREREQARAE